MTNEKNILRSRKTFLDVFMLEDSKFKTAMADDAISSKDDCDNLGYVYGLVAESPENLCRTEASPRFLFEGG